MRIPIILTTAHRGKALEVDSLREVITLVGPRGERIGTVTWQSIIEQILSASEGIRPPETRSQDTRSDPRVSMLVKVRYGIPGGKRLESRAVGIGLGGMFIESASPLAVGTAVELQFALPDRPEEWLEVTGTVAWVCPKADQYTLSPGMGVRFGEVPTEVRVRLMEVVNSVKWAAR
jgi:type IV pilus assembly protein PilZ